MCWFQNKLISSEKVKTLHNHFTNIHTYFTKINLVNIMKDFTRKYLLSSLVCLPDCIKYSSDQRFTMYGIENECRGIWEIYTSVSECIFSIYHGTRFSVSLRPRDCSCFSYHNSDTCAY